MSRGKAWYILLPPPPHSPDPKYALQLVLKDYVARIVMSLENLKAGMSGRRGRERYLGEYVDFKDIISSPLLFWGREAKGSRKKEKFFS